MSTEDGVNGGCVESLLEYSKDVFGFGLGFLVSLSYVYMLSGVYKEAGGVDLVGSVLSFPFILSCLYAMYRVVKNRASNFEMGFLLGGIVGSLWLYAMRNDFLQDLIPSGNDVMST